MVACRAIRRGDVIYRALVLIIWWGEMRGIYRDFFREEVYDGGVCLYKGE